MQLYATPPVVALKLVLDQRVSVGTSRQTAAAGACALVVVVVVAAAAVVLHLQ